MVTGRTTYRESRDRAMLLGTQLEREIHVAMASADIPSVAELSRRATVQRDTLYAWFRGERAPKPETLKKVADTLGAWGARTNRPRVLPVAGALALVGLYGWGTLISVAIGSLSPRYQPARDPAGGVGR